MKDAILFWPRFFREAWVSHKYYKAVRSIKPDLEAANLRIDWIGRVYGVVDIKDEFATQPEMVQQSMVFQELGPINNIMMKHGLSDLSYPEISKIKGTNQFLVVLYPENDYFNWMAFLRNMTFVTLLITLGFTINWIISLFMV